MTPADQEGPRWQQAQKRRWRQGTPTFAHLFATLSTPEVAIDVLSRTQQTLTAAGLHTHRTPFGWFNTLQIDAKGHPISRVARMVSADA